MHSFNIPILGDTSGIQMELLDSTREETITIVLIVDERIIRSRRDPFSMRSKMYFEIDIQTLAKGIKAVKRIE